MSDPLTLKQIEDADDPPDPVNPSHYASHTHQTVDIVRDYNLNFDCGNAIKYIMRHKEKNGPEDIKKAVWYLLEYLGVPIPKIVEITKGLP